MRASSSNQPGFISLQDSVWKARETLSLHSAGSLDLHNLHEDAEPSRAIRMEAGGWES